MNEYAEYAAGYPSQETTCQNGVTHYALDDKTMRFIEVRIAQVNALQAEVRGVLSFIIDQAGLTGGWDLDLPGKRLVPVPQANEQIKAVA